MSGPVGYPSAGTCDRKRQECAELQASSSASTAGGYLEPLWNLYLTSVAENLHEKVHRNVIYTVIWGESQLYVNKLVIMSELRFSLNRSSFSTFSPQFYRN